MLRGLRTVPLTESRAFGRATLRDILVARGHITLPEGQTPALDSAPFEAAKRDTDSAPLGARLAAARAAQAEVAAIERSFSKRTPGPGPPLGEVAVSRAGFAGGSNF